LNKSLRYQYPRAEARERRGRAFDDGVVHGAKEQSRPTSPGSAGARRHSLFPHLSRTPEESAGEWRQERLAPTSHPPHDPAERDKGFCGKNGIFFQPCSAYLWSNSFCLVCFLGPWRPLFMLREGARWRRETPPPRLSFPPPPVPDLFVVGRVCAGGRALMQHFQGSRKKSHEPRFVEIQQVPNKKKEKRK